MNQKSLDETVSGFLEIIEQKKQKISKIERPSWRTNCSFGYSTNSNDRINIQTIKDVAVLVDIYAFLKRKFVDFEDALKTLGLNKIMPRYLGYTFEDWHDDIIFRIRQLNVSNEKEELAVLEAKVNALVSPEQRRAMEIAALAKELSNAK